MMDADSLLSDVCDDTDDYFCAEFVNESSDDSDDEEHSLDTGEIECTSSAIAHAPKRARASPTSLLGMLTVPDGAGTTTTTVGEESGLVWSGPRYSRYCQPYVPANTILQKREN